MNMIRDFILLNDIICLIEISITTKETIITYDNS